MKIGFDTAENEPPKVWAAPSSPSDGDDGAAELGAARGAAEARGDLLTTALCNHDDNRRPPARRQPTLESSFEAVSKPIFAPKYAFFSIFQALQHYQTFAPLQFQFFSIFANCSDEMLADFFQTLLKID